MFGISIGEIFIIIIVALIVIKPEDLPYYISEAKKILKKIKILKQELSTSKQQFKDILNEQVNLETYSRELNDEIQEIIGEDGKIYPTYPQFLENKKK